MGVDRGVIQGSGAYFWLSSAYSIEGVIRLGASVVLGYALLSAGRSLDGAIWGLAQSVLATWFVSWLGIRHLQSASHTAPNTGYERNEWRKLASVTLIALIGQALITNSDFILVKNFFSPEDAGLYAAISVLGRIVYFGALPLTILLVPMIARRQALNQPTRPILLLLIGGASVVCGMLIAGSWFAGQTIIGMLYGEAYLSSAGLLAPYALAASLYTLANLVVTYQIARGSGGETWMPLLAGSLQIAGIVLFHETLMQVILVQIALMGFLFLLIGWRVLRRDESLSTIPETISTQAA
jgi:O-antigen/teichoic acid export membrane protein